MRSLENYSKRKVNIFNNIIEQYNLSDKPVTERIKILMEKAINYKKEIIQSGEKIKNEIFNEANRDIVLNERLFNTFLSIADKMAEGKDVDKTVSKLIENNLSTKYEVTSTKAFIDGYVYNSDPTKKFKMPDFDEIIINDNSEQELKNLSVDADKLVASLHDGILEKSKINSFNSLLNNIVFTISVLISTDNEEIKPSAIKKIIDMEVTKDGFPDIEKKPKLYSLIENLNTTSRLYNKLGLDTFNEKLAKFGLSVKEDKDFVTTTKWCNGVVETSDGEYQEF